LIDISSINWKKNLVILNVNSTKIIDLRRPKPEEKLKNGKTISYPGDSNPEHLGKESEVKTPVPLDN
jgi:hypothetical protein